MRRSRPRRATRGRASERRPRATRFPATRNRRLGSHEGVEINKSTTTNSPWQDRSPEASRPTRRARHALAPRPRPSTTTPSRRPVTPSPSIYERYGAASRATNTALLARRRRRSGSASPQTDRAVRDGRVNADGRKAERQEDGLPAQRGRRAPPSGLRFGRRGGPRQRLAERRREGFRAAGPWARGAAGRERVAGARGAWQGQGDACWPWLMSFFRAVMILSP
jgi:hypothetical protein